MAHFLKSVIFEVCNALSSQKCISLNYIWGRGSSLLGAPLANAYRTTAKRMAGNNNKSDLIQVI